MEKYLNNNSIKFPCPLDTDNDGNCGVSDCENVHKMTHFQKVDWLRQEIDKLDEVLMTMNYNGEFKVTDFFFLCYNNARTYLNEARFHLGFELGRLREENNVIK